MIKLVINFYDEEITVNMPENLVKFNDLICEKFNLIPSDVEELLIYYKLDGDKICIVSELDYLKAISYWNTLKLNFEEFFVEMFLEVVESSRLYRKECESSKFTKLNFSSLLFNESDFDLSQLRKEKLKKEIEEKESQLNELLVMERIAKMEIVKKEQERLEKERLEREIMEEEQLRDSILQTVKDIVSSKIEKVKDDLINKTIMETTSAVEQVVEAQTLNASKIVPEKSKPFEFPAIHLWYSCDGCGQYPIRGTRYRCFACPNFDFCEACEEKYSEEHEHAFIKLRYSNNFNLFVRNCEENSNENPILKFFKKTYEGIKNLFCKKSADSIPNNEDAQPSDMNSSGCSKSSKSSKSSNSSDICNKEMFERQLYELRKYYYLGSFTDDDILSLLCKTEGNIDETLRLLYNMKN